MTADCCCRTAILVLQNKRSSWCRTLIVCELRSLVKKCPFLLAITHTWRSLLGGHRSVRQIHVYTYQYNFVAQLKKAHKRKDFCLCCYGVQIDQDRTLTDLTIHEDFDAKTRLQRQLYSPWGPCMFLQEFDYM